MRADAASECEFFRLNGSHEMVLLGGFFAIPAIALV